MIVFLTSCAQDPQGLDPKEFEATPKTIDFVFSPPNGQSNAVNWKNFIGDDESGASELERIFQELTGLPSLALPKNEDGKFIVFAEGGSTVDAKTTSQGDTKIWWHIEENRPGGALLRSSALLKQELAKLKAQYGDNIVIKMPWAQGESNASYIRARKTSEEKFEFVERYKIGTKAVFEYVQAELGHIDFFIVHTSLPDEIGARNRGLTDEQITSLKDACRLIRDAQKELIEELPNVYLGADPLGLATMREWEPVERADDYWHYSPETYEILGRQTGQNIAKQMGY